MTLSYYTLIQTDQHQNPRVDKKKARRIFAASQLLHSGRDTEKLFTGADTTQV